MASFYYLLLDKSTKLAYNIGMIYDRFQQESIDHINNGHSVIVSAPTGAGKTAIAEHVIQTCLDQNVGVIYTAPIKALSNQNSAISRATIRRRSGS
jgi:superfamily II RNA helicase